MLLNSSFLRFKPSHIAATALLLSINVHSSPIAQLVGLPEQLTNLRRRSFLSLATIGNGGEEHKEGGFDSGPLADWNYQVIQITGLNPQTLAPCYRVLFQLAN